MAGHKKGKIPCGVVMVAGSNKTCRKCKAHARAGEACPKCGNQTYEFCEGPVWPGERCKHHKDRNDIHPDAPRDPIDALEWYMSEEEIALYNEFKSASTLDVAKSWAAWASVQAAKDPHNVERVGEAARMAMHLATIREKETRADLMASQLVNKTAQPLAGYTIKYTLEDKASVTPPPAASDDEDDGPSG